MQSFPKIFHIGDRPIKQSVDVPVEVTEKIDGSQLGFMRKGEDVFIRSKGAFIYDGDHFVRDIPENDLFYPAVQYILMEQDYLLDSHIYYGETLCKPKHSTLAYDKTPQNNIALFGVLDPDGVPFEYAKIKNEAMHFGVGVVKLLYTGMKPEDISTSEWIETFLKSESQLGGPKIEGVVVKRYQEHLVGSQLLPIMSGKYVSEAFKEVHNKNWNKENTGRGKWQTYKEGFRTEARWNKAVQYLKEKGELTGTPKDIGPLIERIKDDISEEEKHNIMEKLWNEFGKDILSESVKGFPEFYKKQLMNGGD